MKYDFTTVLDRKGKDAVALDRVGDGNPYTAPKEGFDVIPMWIADMDMACPECIVNAIKSRADKEIFGY